MLNAMYLYHNTHYYNFNRVVKGHYVQNRPHTHSCCNHYNYEYYHCIKLKVVEYKKLFINIFAISFAMSYYMYITTVNICILYSIHPI